MIKEILMEKTMLIDILSLNVKKLIKIRMLKKNRVTMFKKLSQNGLEPMKAAKPQQDARQLDQSQVDP